MNTIGDRITYCRSTIGLTRKELAELWGEVSVPTLSRWELDSIEPTHKKISLIVDFFSSKGLIVSPEWIQSGQGLAPSHLNMSEFTEDDFDALCEQNFLSLNQKIRNFAYYKVTSNFFAPMVRYGDYVGGVRIEANLADCINSLVFVAQENTVHVGFLDNVNVDTITIKNSQAKLIEFNHYNFLAKVHWTAIRP